ncbi:MAG TPA: hypothetical protein VGE74_16720 [Gemmata sp.]
MSNLLKCPNPSCPYTFDPSQVPAGVVLSCPRCAMQFTLGPPAPPPPPPPERPRARPRGRDPVDDFEAVGREAERDRADDVPRPGHRTSRYQLFILAGIAASLMAGTALVFIFKLMSRKTSSAGRESSLKAPEWNFSIEGLPKGWTLDDTTKLKVSSPYAYGFKRENPEGYVVVGRTEYAKGRAPRGTEMRHDLERPFRKLFTKFEEEPPLEATWMGQPVGPRLGFKFRAPSSDGLIWQGEAYAVSFKGIAYFWLGWSGESDFDNLKDDFAAFRNRFKLLDLRSNWRETVAPEVEYKGATVPYTFTDGDDVWKEESLEQEKKESPELDRWLRINHTPRGDRKALSDDADLRIYLVDGTGDPLQTARDYVQNLWTNHVKAANDQLPAPTFTERSGEPEGDPLPKGATPVIRLESQVLEPGTKKVLASSESRLVVVSGVRVGDKIVILHCWCEFSKRGTFESRFVQIASSLR